MITVDNEGGWPGYFTLFGSRGGGGVDAPPPLVSIRGGILNSRRGIRFFTNNMIFLECGVIALFEAFYVLRDHNHVKMRFEMLNDLSHPVVPL